MPSSKKKSVQDLLLMEQLFLSATFLLVLGVWQTTSQYKNIFFQYSEQSKVSSVAKLEMAIGKARVVFNFGQTKRTFEGPVIVDQKIDQTIKQAAQAGNINLVWKNDADGNPHLAGVGEFLNGAKKWAAYVNGKPLQTALYETAVKPYDEILLVYR